MCNLFILAFKGLYNLALSCLSIFTYSLFSLKKYSLNTCSVLSIDLGIVFSLSYRYIPIKLRYWISFICLSILIYQVLPTFFLSSGTHAFHWLLFLFFAIHFPGLSQLLLMIFLLSIIMFCVYLSKLYTILTQCSYLIHLFIPISLRDNSYINVL